MLDLAELAALSSEEIAKRAAKDVAWAAQIRAELDAQVAEYNQTTHLASYTVANPNAINVHLSTAREIALVGGNRSSKTDTMLAELAIRMTGCVPNSLAHVYPKSKLANLPIRARIVCNSLTSTLEPVIKPKLRWDQWSGVGEPIEGRGHYGWIPKHCLPGGNWDKAYSDKYRTLHVYVDNYWTGASGVSMATRGVSTCQFLSYDQELTDFAGQSLHFVGHDELPPQDIYRENRVRTLDVQGQIITAFTPPDEIGMVRGDVGWFYDEVYEPGLSPNQRFESIVLHTERNRILSAADVADLAATMTEEQREVRLHGNFLHLSGVIYSMFVKTPATWCFKCQKRMTPMGGACLTCHGTDFTEFCHVVEPYAIPSSWPIVFVIDPHPRKKDAMGWFAITPSDNIVMVAELEVDGTAKDVKRAVDAIEHENHFNVVHRLMDPNIATQTNDKLQRGWTFRKAYDEAGLRCALATDDINVGIQNVITLLTPDIYTRSPRFHVSSSCKKFIYGMTHWSWDEWTRAEGHEPKEKVRERAKDFPDLLRYLANDHPDYKRYHLGREIVHTLKRRTYGAAR